MILSTDLLVINFVLIVTEPLILGCGDRGPLLLSVVAQFDNKVFFCFSDDEVPLPYYRILTYSITNVMLFFYQKQRILNGYSAITKRSDH